MSENFENFPKIDQAKESIERLKKVVWPETSEFKNADEFLKKVEEIIFKEFEILPNLFKLFKPSDFTLPFFRVREIDSFTNINLFSEHSYPPINLTGFNRCNFPKSPVFYCSDNPMTALMEVVRNSNYKQRKFCISKWELIDSDKHFAFQTFLQTEIHQDNHYGVLRDAEIEQMDKPFEYKLDKERKAGLIEYLKFLHSTFINDKSYALSASIAHRTLNAKHNLATDILMYPSIQTQYKGVNMAINPNFVDNMMRVQRFYIVELENYNIETGKFNITISKYGDIDKNIIFWKNLNPDDEIYKNNLLTDFKSLMDDNFEWKFNEIKK
ncbi:RES domain-containing protein [Myroides sp. JBRI-B21084]|uniref:RES domain-containing protein n=1 Tax=Myroides sp. JBRI-B21084 TaxID=3119977 RepID=UPI0026E157EA|nr:RES domain-containing protein [Paenimyroides cloacae]WKW46165.1 RES domain-containing protein [Paenimyroides cloacae]